MRESSIYYLDSYVLMALGETLIPSLHKNKNNHPMQKFHYTVSNDIEAPLMAGIGSISNRIFSVISNKVYKMRQESQHE